MGWRLFRIPWSEGKHKHGEKLDIENVSGCEENDVVQLAENFPTLHLIDYAITGKTINFIQV